MPLEAAKDYFSFRLNIEAQEVHISRPYSRKTTANCLLGIN
jgi:hypothetical protein